jgi:hypothetical protein
MRPRCAAAISLMAVSIAAALPSAAGASPFHNRGLTIAATPNPITAGEGVLIYGAMRGQNNGNQQVDLYHHIAGTPGYSLIGTTQTDPQGFYEFTRAEGIVMTNRSWFVTGAGMIHSRTIYESVQAVVTLGENTGTAITGQDVTFAGTVTPAHPGQEVLLQRQNNAGGWGTVATGQLDSTSSFNITRAFGRANDYTLRAVFPGDLRNARGESDAVSLNVQQQQVPGFTINSSSPIITYGQSITISGVLDQPGSNAVEPNTEVTLFGRAYGGPMQAIETTTTGTDGSYSFPTPSGPSLTPTTNTAYKVVTTLAPRRHTAVLFEGVSDVISLTATPTTVEVGQPVTFSGNVTPNNAGQIIYLQRLAPNGHWVIVGEHYINPDGSYSFTRVFGQPLTAQFRTRVFGDGYNIGSASSPVTVTVAGVPPVTSLPPASAGD